MRNRRKYKKIIIIVFIIIVIFLLLSTLPSLFPKKELTLDCYFSDSKGEIRISGMDGNDPVSDITVFVNLTDENNHTYEEKVPLHNGYGSIRHNVNAGKYNVSIYFPGDDTFKSSSHTDSLEVTKSSNDYSNGGSKTYTRTYVYYV